MAGCLTQHIIGGIYLPFILKLDWIRIKSSIFRLHKPCWAEKPIRRCFVTEKNDRRVSHHPVAGFQNQNLCRNYFQCQDVGNRCLPQSLWYRTWICEYLWKRSGVSVLCTAQTTILCYKSRGMLSRMWKFWNIIYPLRIATC